MIDGMAQGEGVVVETPIYTDGWMDNGGEI